VLRNAARAAFVKSAATGEPLGEVTVVIADADDNSDVVVKVSDTAGGIPRSKLNRIFSFSAASRNYKEVANDLADQSLCQALGPASLQGGAPDVLSPASDEGHALPLAKVYATLFGGDLKLLSMEGHGTDCYVYISRIEDNVLPT
jgi:pyruvate dehydrogenase kinase 2/3/4